jgi:HlyD family secretion protein
MKTMIRRLSAAGAVLCLVAATAGAASCRDKGKKVRTQKVEKGDLVATVSCNGKIEARRKVDLSANVPGQVVNIAIREGDTVKKGDFLLQIDRTNLKAQSDSSQAALQALLSDRDAARASVGQARLDLDRARVSFESGLIPRSDFDRAKTAVDQAEASMASAENRIDQARAALVGARDNLGKTTIVAPIGGVVTRLAVEEGEVAVIGTMNNPGTVLLTIADLAEIEATMEVDETDIPAIRIGQKAKITIDAYPKREFEGTVTEVGSSPMQKSLSGGSTSESIDFEVKVRLASPPDRLKPGLSASATITTGEKSNALSIPIQALALREKEREKEKAGTKPKDEEGVFVVQAGKVKFVPVITGMAGEMEVEVSSGLSGGEEVIVGPFRTLRELKDGDEVVIDNTMPKAEGKQES